MKPSRILNEVVITGAESISNRHWLLKREYCPKDLVKRAEKLSRGTLSWEKISIEEEIKLFNTKTIKLKRTAHFARHKRCKLRRYYHSWNVGIWFWERYLGYFEKHFPGFDLYISAEGAYKTPPSHAIITYEGRDIGLIMPYNYKEEV